MNRNRAFAKELFTAPKAPLGDLIDAARTNLTGHL